MGFGYLNVLFKVVRMESKMQSPLARVRHLGSAKEGVNHWWWQRITAVMLIPLALWFVASLWMIVISGASYEDLVVWISGPVSAALMLVFLGAMFLHLKLGLQVVIEDYVHTKWLKWALITILLIVTILLFTVSIYSVIALSLRG
jgi:succinate dehydrogenase / fumarate reductase membrane anchor subunit